MKGSITQTENPVREPFATSCIVSILMHGLFVGAAIAAAWVWGAPLYYKPSATMVTLVDAPLELNQPEPEPPLVQPEPTPAAEPSRQAEPKTPSPPPLEPKEEPQEPKQDVAENQPAAPAPAAVPEKKPAVPASTAVPEKVPETVLPSKPKPQARPPASRPAPPKRAVPPQIATAVEAQAKVTHLREHQAKQEAERRQAEATQREAASQRIADLRARTTSESEAAIDSTHGLQRIRLQAYQERVREKIIDAWILPLPPEEAHNLQAIAFLLVSREGHIEYLDIVKSSGNPLFDTSLKQAIQRAAPLPALPDAYPGERLEVEMRFSPRDS
jgi:TonB family protein